MQVAKKFGFLLGVFLALGFLPSVQAQVDVDKTCATCGRRQLDSLNLSPRNIRVNQVGYLPQDQRKRAFVANAKTTTFQVINADTRTSAYQGNLTSLGTVTEGGMDIHGYFNSINELYNLKRPPASVALSLADFSPLQTPGRYFIVSGVDTSSTFTLDPQIYNHIFTTTLQFFGAQRCGPTDSWFHKDCHLKDGSALGAAFTGALAGGWHDCGDHGKYSETVAYSALVLAMTYAYWPQKGEDFYGSSYNDTLPFGTDGIPDVLFEAKVGADYILKLYKASVANGLLAKGDMYHSVGNGPGMDHEYWDVPENQEAQPLGRGGPDRPVTAGIGSNVAGMFASALAFFAWGWEPFNPAYAKECLNAAKDIYAKIVIARRGTSTTNPCCYTGGGPSKDDEALTALALWFATKDTTYKYDLLDNPALGRAPLSVFNDGEFPYGLLGNSPFHTGWPTDYQNNYAFTLYGLAKLIVNTHAQAAEYGISPVVADSLKKDALVALKKNISDGSNGKDRTVNPAFGVDPPYNGVWTSIDWGYNRYNLGTVIELFMYWDLTGEKDFYNIGIDNINYNLGLNPWDISFIMGAGDKNLQHPHNRAANPEGYNAGGFPYEYKVPKGALMGGAKPDSILVDFWRDYINTETCIDFSAQIAIPAQMLAEDLPEDKEGPKFRNVNVIPEDVRATVSWTTDELSRDTLFLLDGPGGRLLQAVSPDTLAKSKRLVLLNLTPSTTYYFWFKGMDIRRNVTEDKNGGAYYRFTTLAGPKPPPQITGVKVCNETHEQATVTWWTRNGQYDSRVDYDLASQAGPPTKVKEPDDSGLPTVFHAVTLDGLDAATAYKYSVTSKPLTDDSSGNYYRFRTTQVLVDYDIRVKATNKAQQPGGFQAYIDITNNEQKPYTGVELRFYFTADDATAAGLTAKGNDHQLRGVGGSNIGIEVAFGTNGDGRPVKLAGFTDQWYFPIVIKSTLPVAGRASIDLQIFTGNAWTNYPFSAMTGAWSVRGHTAPPDPVAFAGVDFNPALNGQYVGPEPIEKINGQNVVSYVETQYISAYYEGVHVFGYGPDYVTDVIQKKRVAQLALTAPVVSPLDKIDIRQEQKPVLMVAGQASVSPDGVIDEIWMNGNPLPASDITSEADGSASFSAGLDLAEGANYFDIVAFDTEHCVFASQKMAVNWIKAPPPPPDTVKPVAATPPSKTSRDPFPVALATPTAGATIWYTLDGKDPKPGEAGTTEYKGPIQITQPSVTVKAMATKAGLIPSGITTETYAILPFRLIATRSAWLRDGNADGYADALVLAIDMSEGPLDLPLVLAQLQSAKFSGSAFAFDPAGLIAALAPDAGGNPQGLRGDSLVLPLATNALAVVNGLSDLSIALPAAPQDGLLAPGKLALKDGVAPVLRAAVLHRRDPALAAAPDTLVVVFNETLSPSVLQGKLFSALHVSAGSAYSFTVASGVPRPATLVSGVEAAYAFIVTSATDANGQPVVPESGDSLWINTAAGVGDTAGQVQAHPGNRRVALRLALPLSIRIGPTSTGGVAHVPTPGPLDPTWSVIATGGGEIGAPGGARVPVRDNADPSRFGGLTVEASAPFRLSLRIFSNLGQSVSGLALVLDEAEFARLPILPNGSRRFTLLWNGRSQEGQLAGTGAYIYSWNVSSTDNEGRAVSQSDQKIYGLLRYE